MDQRREGHERRARTARSAAGQPDDRRSGASGDERGRRRPAPVDTRSRRTTRRTSAEIHTRPRRTDSAARPAAGATGHRTLKSDLAALGRAAGTGARGLLNSAGTLATTVRRRPRSLANLGRAIVALLTVAALVVTGYGWSQLRSLNSSVTLLGGLDLGGGGSDGALDILLVGTDSRLDAKGNPLSEEELKWLRVGDEITTSTDTILLIRIPKDGSAATAISIPRDSYVDVPGLGMSKINAAYGTTKEGVRRRAVESGESEKQAEADGAKAGRKTLIETVGNLTGVTVDHYAEVGLLGFALLTDAVGGVPVCLKAAVREPLSGARFRKGTQTLNGPKALSFVRQRHDLPRGDLDRITRQQVFMAALAQKVLSTSTLTNPGKLKELEQAMSRSVVIDDGWDIISLADRLKDLTGGSVKFSTIPVVTEHGWSDDGMQSVVEVDPQQVHTFVDKELGKESRNDSSDVRSDTTVDVTNAGTVDGLAANVAGLLGGKGWKEGELSNEPMDEFDSLIFAKDPDSDAAKQLAKDLGGNIAIREDSSLPGDKLRAVLTNTYTGMGAIWNTGDQGENTNDGASPSGAAKASAAAQPAIKADTKGPVCVN